MDLGIKAERANWLNSTYITVDTDALAAETREDYTAAVTELAEQSRRFDRLKLPYDVERKFKLLKLALTLPAPSNAAEREQLTKHLGDDGERIREGQILPRRRQGEVPEPRRYGAHNGREPRPRGA